MMCLMLGGTGGLPKKATNFNLFGNSKDDRCVKGLLNGMS
jgi:hypothetical protein